MIKTQTWLAILAALTLIGCMPESYEQLAILQTNLVGCQFERIAKEHKSEENVAWLVTNPQKQQYVVWFRDVSSHIYVKPMGQGYDQPAELIEKVQAWQKILQQAEKPIDNR